MMKQLPINHLQLALVVCTAFLMSLMSCTPQSVSNREAWIRHDSWSDQVTYTSWPDIEKRGFGVGFMRPEDQDIHPYERASTHLFELKSGELFDPKLLISSGLPEPTSMLISLFVDYEQKSFSLDGVEGKLHFMVIEPDTDLEIPLQVEIDGEGWHDLFVAVFLGPERHPIDEDPRLPGARLSLGGRRTVVCVNTCVLNQPLPDPIMGTQAVETKITAGALPLKPGEQLPKQRLLLILSVKPDTAFDFDLWGVNNDYDETAFYMVIPLFDFLQVPISPGGSDTLYFSLSPNQEILLPGQLVTPHETGVHELLFLTIFDPYQPINETLSPFILSESRAGIIVEE